MERLTSEQSDNSETNPIVFLDIAVETEKVGRVVIELFKDIVPKTAENFRALCTGEKGISPKGKKLHYKGAVFHKVIPKLMIQGGDIVNFNGTSGESIYGPHFEDENFKRLHDSPGLLSMVNEDKPHTNSSQFIITVTNCPHLDNNNVVFGKVLKGMGVVVEVSVVKAEKDIPIQKVYIADCGELKRDGNWGLEENDGSMDVFTPWPEDWDYSGQSEELDHDYVTDVIKKIKDSGNHYFKKKNYVDAGRKYKKALRYHKWMVKEVNIPSNLDESMTDLKMVILLNLAAVKLKKKQHQEALALCNEVLQWKKNNSKALFRRSQAYIGLHEYDLGLVDLNQALSESPNNKDILQEIAKVKEIQNSYLAVEKAACQRMFN